MRLLTSRFALVLGLGLATILPLTDAALAFEAANSSDYDLDLLVYDAYLSARKVSLGNLNYFVSGEVTIETIRAAIEEDITEYPGVEIHTDLTTPKSVEACAAQGVTALNIFVTPAGDGISIAAVNSVSSSSYHYDPLKSLELVEEPAHPCLARRNPLN